VAFDRQMRPLRTPNHPSCFLPMSKKKRRKGCTCTFSRRHSVHCTWDAYLYQTVDRRLTPVTPPSLRRLDKTGFNLTYAGTLTDLARSKTALLAGNELLRKPLVLLRRQVKRPTCTKTDRMLLVLLARMVRTWKQAHITRSAKNAPPLASSGM
jgi:hypothetical protein